MARVTNDTKLNFKAAINETAKLDFISLTNNPHYTTVRNTKIYSSNRITNNAFFLPLAVTTVRDNDLRFYTFETYVHENFTKSKNVALVKSGTIGWKFF